MFGEACEYSPSVEADLGGVPAATSLGLVETATLLGLREVQKGLKTVGAIMIHSRFLLQRSVAIGDVGIVSKIIKRGLSPKLKVARYLFKT